MGGGIGRESDDGGGGMGGGEEVEWGGSDGRVGVMVEWE